MPIKPSPISVHCKQCGWKRTYAPISDALIEYKPDVCPKCEGKELETVAASIIETTLSGLNRFFGKR
jgi:hypothetical protein